MRRILVAAAVALTLSATRTAQAEQSESAKTLDEAVSEFGQGHFEEARALFERAHALEPTARTLRGIGMAEFELRHYVKSLRLLRQALSDLRKPLTADLRAKTEDLARRAERFVARYRPSIEPAGAVLEVDGATAELEMDGALWLNTGEHSLKVTASGFTTHEEKLDAVGGSEQELAIHLEAAATSVAPPPSEAITPAPEAAAETQPEPRTGPGVWPWVVVGASGALMIAGGVLVVMAQSDVSKVQDAAKGTKWSAVQSAYDAAPGKSAAGFALLGVGAVGVAAGLLWRFAWSHPSEEHPNVSATLGPSGMMLAGSF